MYQVSIKPNLIGCVIGIDINIRQLFKANCLILLIFPSKNTRFSLIRIPSMCMIIGQIENSTKTKQISVVSEVANRSNSSKYFFQ